MNARKLFAPALAVCALLGTSGFGGNAFASLTEPVTTHAASQLTEIPRTTVEELRALMTRGDVIVIDVRAPDIYEFGHIKGSRLMPVADMEGQRSSLPRDKQIVTYCS